MSQEVYPNGVFGINLSQLLEGPGLDSLALLQEMYARMTELKASADEVDASLYREFKDRLTLVLAKKGIGIPETGALDRDSFQIYQVDNATEIHINDEDDFEEGDLILGIGILGFPNTLYLPPSFLTASRWHLWTVFA